MLFILLLPIFSIILLYIDLQGSNSKTFPSIPTLFDANKEMETNVCTYVKKKHTFFQIIINKAKNFRFTITKIIQQT